MSMKLMQTEKDSDSTASEVLFLGKSCYLLGGTLVGWLGVESLRGEDGKGYGLMWIMMYIF